MEESTEEKKVLPNYQWAGDAEFKLSGAKLEQLYGVCQTYLSQQKAQEVLAIMSCFDTLNGIIRQGIADGTIVDANIIKAE